MCAYTQPCSFFLEWSKCNQMGSNWQPAGIMFWWHDTEGKAHCCPNNLYCTPALHNYTSLYGLHMHSAQTLYYWCCCCCVTNAISGYYLFKLFFFVQQRTLHFSLHLGYYYILFQSLRAILRTDNNTWFETCLDCWNNILSFILCLTL